MSTVADNQIILGKFDRPTSGIRWANRAGNSNGVPVRGLYGWQSNGGTQNHPDRTLPYDLDVEVPAHLGPLHRVHIVGIFALYANHSLESKGTIGATVRLVDGSKIVFKESLINGRHYSDAASTRPFNPPQKGPITLVKAGEVNVDGRQVRVDHLCIELPNDARATHLQFKDAGSPGSFVIFEVGFETEEHAVCPFSAKFGGISLSDVPSIVRIGDRVRFNKAVSQLQESLARIEDINEARGLALTFLAVTTAATLEMGGVRAFHKVQLDASRAIDKLFNVEDIIHCLGGYLEEVAGPLMGPKSSPSERLIDKSLSLVDKTYMRAISDETVAHQLGLSTSHFRFLFKRVTGQPFHKYLMSVRLERARSLLLDTSLPVSQVAENVGFSGLSHFSRVFTQRFNVSPTSLRRTQH